MTCKNLSTLPPPKWTSHNGNNTKRKKKGKKVYFYAFTYKLQKKVQQICSNFKTWKSNLIPVPKFRSSTSHTHTTPKYPQQQNTINNAEKSNKSGRNLHQYSTISLYNKVLLIIKTFNWKFSIIFQNPHKTLIKQKESLKLYQKNIIKSQKKKINNQRLMIYLTTNIATQIITLFRTVIPSRFPHHPPHFRV